MKRVTGFLCISCLSILHFVAPMVAGEEAPLQSFDGLLRVERPKFDVAYVDPDADFSVYSKFMILEPGIAFKKNWKREHGNVSNSDMERIRRRLAALFTEVFTDVLEDAGYPVVSAPGDDVLLVRPALVDLDISAPDTLSSGRSRTFVTGAGAMTLYVEAYDSVTGAILARAIDRKAARDTGHFNLSSSVYSSSEARKVLTDRGP